jgi:recombination protein RecA
MLASCQRIGGLAILIDSEYAYDPYRASTIGLDIETTIVLQPVSLEDAFNQIEKAIETIREEDPDIPVMIAIDSVAGLPTEAESKAAFGDSMSWGSHARIVSLALRRITRKIADQKIAFVFVNQTKERTDVQFGDATTMIADNPISFHSCIILEATRMGVVGDTADPKGILTRIKVTKNKMAPPLKQISFDCLFSSGMDVGKSYGQAALMMGLAKKKGGGWLDINGQSIRESEFLGQYLADEELARTFDEALAERFKKNPLKVGDRVEETNVG